MNTLPPLTVRRAASLFGDDTGAATAEYAITTMAAVDELGHTWSVELLDAPVGAEQVGKFLTGVDAPGWLVAANPTRMAS